MAGIEDDKKAEVEVKGAEAKDVVTEEDGEELRFSPEEEAALLEESNASKAEANALFGSNQYQDALDTYESALSSCPKYLHYPRAVIQSNIAACHLKQEQWKDAIKAASDALDGLAKMEREDPRLNGEGKTEKGKEKAEGGDATKDDDEDVEEEIISDGASRSAPAPSPPVDETLETLETLKANIHRIRLKSLLRRARARSSAGGWQHLTGAEEDYKTLSSMPGLTAADSRTVRAQLRELPPRAKVAQEKEMGEMWGKLKDLGNGILKPFGLSTENFQMVKDENTGGYSMNFNQGGASS